MVQKYEKARLIPKVKVGFSKKEFNLTARKNSNFKTNEKLNLEKIMGVFVGECKIVERFLGYRMFKTVEYFTFVYILFALFSRFCNYFITAFRLSHGLFASKSRSDS